MYFNQLRLTKNSIFFRIIIIGEKTNHLQIHDNYNVEKLKVYAKIKLISLVYKVFRSVFPAFFLNARGEKSENQTKS